MLSMAKPDISSGQRIIDKAEAIARTVISQQVFYNSQDCNKNHRQLLETMVGAAIWYFPQSEDLWTGSISVEALKAMATSQKPKAVKLTKDHHYPRKGAAAELFALNWTEVDDPAAEMLQRYLNCYGQFNYVLPEENKRLVKYQKAHTFISPEDAYAQAGIGLKQLSRPLLNAIRAG